jgi:putative PIN family toxin of toxin-antitoxin system
VPARVTPDSNILISALIFGGNPLRLIEMALNGEIAMFVSDAIVHETLRVLRDKFGFSDQRLAQAEEYIIRSTERVKPAKTLDVVKEDPDDNRVLECAEAAGCETIITGDLDLLRLRKHGEIRIMTVREFLVGGMQMGR